MKYMITGIGESEIILIGNSKSKLTKEALQIVKSTFEAYKENCEYLQEKADIKYSDFKCFEIEEYNENFINKLVNENGFILR